MPPARTQSYQELSPSSKRKRTRAENKEAEEIRNRALITAASGTRSAKEKALADPVWTRGIKHKRDAKTDEDEPFSTKHLKQQHEGSNASPSPNRTRTEAKRSHEASPSSSDDEAPPPMKKKRLSQKQTKQTTVSEDDRSDDDNDRSSNDAAADEDDDIVPDSDVAPDMESPVKQTPKTQRRKPSRRDNDDSESESSRVRQPSHKVSPTKTTPPPTKTTPPRPTPRQPARLMHHRTASEMVAQSQPVPEREHHCAPPQRRGQSLPLLAEDDTAEAAEAPARVRQAKKDQPIVVRDNMHNTCDVDEEDKGDEGDEDEDIARRRLAARDSDSTTDEDTAPLNLAAEKATFTSRKHMKARPLDLDSPQLNNEAPPSPTLSEADADFARERRQDKDHRQTREQDPIDSEDEVNCSHQTRDKGKGKQRATAADDDESEEDLHQTQSKQKKKKRAVVSDDEDSEDVDAISSRNRQPKNLKPSSAPGSSRTTHLASSSKSKLKPAAASKSNATASSSKSKSAPSSSKSKPAVSSSNTKSTASSSQTQPTASSSKSKTTAPTLALSSKSKSKAAASTPAKSKGTTRLDKRRGERAEIAEDGAESESDNQPVAPKQRWPADTNLERSGSHLNIGTASERMQPILTTVGKLVQMDCVLYNAYPEYPERLKYLQEVLQDAAKEHGDHVVARRVAEDPAYFNVFRLLPEHRLIIARSGVKKGVEASVTKDYGLKPGHGCAARVRKWKSQKRYIYPGDSPESVDSNLPFRASPIIDGITHLYFTGTKTFVSSHLPHFAVKRGRKTFYAATKAMVALVATGVHAVLSDWDTGVHQSRNFSTTSSQLVYADHIRMLNKIERKRKNAYLTMMIDIFNQASNGQVYTTSEDADEALEFLDLDDMPEDIMPSENEEAVNSNS